MQKIYLGFLPFILLLYSCDKDQTEDPVDQPKDSICHISRQDGFAMKGDHSSLVPYGAGFQKFYSTDGKIHRLNAASYNWFVDIDSLFYDMSYDGNIVHITETHRVYRRGNEDSLILDTETEDNFDVIFNSD